MLTPRQKEILRLIVQLYSRYEEPIGSKTLLQESLLKVSPATIRNDMAHLESEGLLMKPHTSSGRVPSQSAYRFYVQGLIDKNKEEGKSQKREMDDDDVRSLAALLEARHYNPLQLAQLAADILVSLTRFTVVTLGQDQENHLLEEFKLVPLNNTEYLAILMTDSGRIESDIIDLGHQFTRELIHRLVELINDELQGMTLEDVYTRMKLSIPLLTQRAIGYQIDFLPLIEKARDNIKGHQYSVSGKSNLFNFIQPGIHQDAFKEVFELLDGSRKMFELMESTPQGIDVKFGQDFLSYDLGLNMVTGSYFNQNQKIVLGVIGPSSMAYERIIPMVDSVVNILINQ